MRQQAAIDGFRLAYERTGSGPAVLLLHGWPGDRTDYRAVVPLVSRAADVVVPDLRGFGESDKHPADPALPYNPARMVRPDRRVLRRCPSDLARRRRPLLAAGSTRRLRRRRARRGRDRPVLSRGGILGP